MRYHGLLCPHFTPRLQRLNINRRQCLLLRIHFALPAGNIFVIALQKRQLISPEAFAFLCVLKNLREPFFYDRAKRKRLLCWVLTYDTKYRRETSLFIRYEQTAVIFAYAVGFRGKVGRQRMYLAEARLQGITGTSLRWETLLKSKI